MSHSLLGHGRIDPWWETIVRDGSSDCGGESVIIARKDVIDVSECQCEVIASKVKAIVTGRRARVRIVCPPFLDLSVPSSCAMCDVQWEMHSCAVMRAD